MTTDALDVDSFFDLLNKDLETLLQEISCVKCGNTKPENPVELKTCSHFSCSRCFNKKSTQCPRCWKIYLPEDVDFDPKTEPRPHIELIHQLHDVLTADDVASTLPGHNIIKINNRNHFLEFIDQNPKRNARGESELHTACRKKDLRRVEKLLQSGYNLNVKDFAGWAPVHDAIVGGSLELVKMLLDNGALVNLPGEDYLTPLHKAALEGSPEMIRTLLQYGADVRLKDAYNRTASDLTALEDVKNIIETPLPAGFPLRGVQKLFVPKQTVAYYQEIDRRYSEMLKKSNNKNIKVSKDLNAAHLTHMIIKESCNPSAKILLAMLRGLFIVPQTWIKRYLDDRFYLPLTIDSVLTNNQALNEGIRKATLNHLMGCPKLFHGINFYVRPFAPGAGADKKITLYDHVVIDEGFVKELIKAGDGKILKRAPTPVSITQPSDSAPVPYHLAGSTSLRWCHNYIIYAPNCQTALKYNMTELKHKSVNWLIYSVLTFSIENDVN